MSIDVTAVRNMQDLFRTVEQNFDLADAISSKTDLDTDHLSDIDVAMGKIAEAARKAKNAMKTLLDTKQFAFLNRELTELANNFGAIVLNSIDPKDYPSAMKSIGLIKLKFSDIKKILFRKKDDIFGKDGKPAPEKSRYYELKGSQLRPTSPTKEELAKEEADTKLDLMNKHKEVERKRQDEEQSLEIRRLLDKDDVRGAWDIVATMPNGENRNKATQAILESIYSDPSEENRKLGDDILARITAGITADFKIEERMRALSNKETLGNEIRSRHPILSQFDGMLKAAEERSYTVGYKLQSHIKRGNFEAAVDLVSKMPKGDNKNEAWLQIVVGIRSKPTASDVALIEKKIKPLITEKEILARVQKQLDGIKEDKSVPKQLLEPGSGMPDLGMGNSDWMNRFRGNGAEFLRVPMENEWDLLGRPFSMDYSPTHGDDMARIMAALGGAKKDSIIDTHYASASAKLQKEAKYAEFEEALKEQKFPKAKGIVDTFADATAKDGALLELIQHLVVEKKDFVHARMFVWLLNDAKVAEAVDLMLEEKEKNAASRFFSLPKPEAKKDPAPEVKKTAPLTAEKEKEFQDHVDAFYTGFLDESIIWMKELTAALKEKNGAKAEELLKKQKKDAVRDCGVLDLVKYLTEAKDFVGIERVAKLLEDEEVRKAILKLMEQNKWKAANAAAAAVDTPMPAAPALVVAPMAAEAVFVDVPMPAAQVIARAVLNDDYDVVGMPPRAKR